MNMARSTYYFEINKTDPVAIRNEELLLVIKKIFVENKGRYGVRRVYMELKNRGYNVNHKRVQRLMHSCFLALVPYLLCLQLLRYHHYSN